MYINRKDEKLHRIVTYVNTRQKDHFDRIVKKYGAGKSAAMRQLLDSALDVELFHEVNDRRVNEK